MFGSFFKGKNNLPQTVLAIDMGTSSLSALLAEKTPGNKHKIIKVLRYRFDLLSTGFEKRGAKVILGGLEKVFKEAHALRPNINCILFSFSDLLVSEHQTKKVMERKPPYSPITQYEIDNYLYGISQKLLQEHENMFLVKKAIVKCTVNGYPVESPVNYRGQTVEMDLEFMLVSSLLFENIKKQKAVYFPGSGIYYHSDPQVFHRALTKTQNVYEPTLVVDVGGEITTMFLMGERMVHADPIIFGIRALERRTASYFGCTFDQAEAMLSQYSRGVMGESKAIELEKLINSALEDWAYEFKSRVVQIAPHAKNIVLSGGGADYNVFLDALKKLYANFLPGVKISTLKTEAFRDYFDSLQGLKGGGDVILACLVLYCD